MRIGIDLDGPLLNFVGAYLRYHNRIYGTAFTSREMTEYDMTKVLGVSHEQHGRDIFAFFASPEYQQIQSFPSAVAAVSALARDHELHIVTARSLDFQVCTAAKVQEHYNGCFRAIHHTVGMGWVTKANKSGLCKELQLDVLIEDSVANAVEVMEKGIPALLISKPWNKQEQLPPYLRRTRWSDIQPAIKRTLIRHRQY